MSGTKPSQAAAKLARLIAENPGLPVYFNFTDESENLGFILRLEDCDLGEWWSTGERVFEDREDAVEHLAWDNDCDPEDVPGDRLEHGRCIWIRCGFAAFDGWEVQ